MSLPQDFLYELHNQFTGEIHTDRASRILYSTDASIYQIEPTGVVFPRNQEELHAAVELAAKYKIPILPRGAGTSLAGQAVGDALIIDCSRWLDSIVKIDAEELTAIVEPGVVLSNLNKAAGEYGLMFGPDPASAERATMGGVIANNATGAHSILYGMSADHLLSADVILGDGSLETWDGNERSKIKPAVENIRNHYGEAIKQNWPETWRNSAGYRLNYLLPWSPSKPARWEGEFPINGNSLAPLLAGSEGTLAVIRRVKVNLVRKPKHTLLAMLSYRSIAEACDDVPRLLTHSPSAVELIPRAILRAARSIPAYASQMGWVAGDPAALLIVEFSGDQPQALKDAALRLPSGQAPGLNGSMAMAESTEEQNRVWNIRKVGLGLMDSKPQARRPVAFIEDCAIPVERLGQFVREVEKILTAHDTEGGIYAHASGGCLHIRPILDLKASADVKSLRGISEAVFAVTMRLGGAMSSEHGDGLARSEYLEQAYGSTLLDAMRLLKTAADPHNILNPGKIVFPQKMDVNLRYGTGYQAQAWKPNLSFEMSGGLTPAIEQCNGQGVCRKESGVMCPSFQATREEMHSTRGRANLLRAMISLPHLNPSPGGRGTQGEGEIEDATHNALDLCLACKGCKAECPSGVDMAKLKYEFVNEYYKTHRRPLRDYLFGYFHLVAGMLAPIAPLVNGMMKFGLTRKLIAHVLGLTSERPLPKFERRLTRKAAAQAKTGREKIIFIPDVFSRYSEPQVEQAALDVLTHCGYDVQVLPMIGAGASMLSKGFLDAARRHAGKVMEALDQLDPEREAAVIGLEPPEIYLLKNDYADLLPDRKNFLQERQKKVWLLEEFLVRSDRFHALRVGTSEEEVFSRGNKQRIIFHPHCHQRAEGLADDGISSGTNATAEVLRACGYDVEVTDAGCCGMSGSFGFEAGHYDLSMRIGELKLFPILAPSRPPPNTKEDKRKLVNDPNSFLGEGPALGVIVSTGAACRMQIRHGVGREAVHPIMLVAERLRNVRIS